MKLANTQVRDLIFEEYLEGFNIIEQSEWEQEHKNQYSTIIIQSDLDEKFYSVSVNRSGSYHTDWYYCFEYKKEYECPEVQKVVVQSYEWRKV